MTRKRSPIDDLYARIMGCEPPAKAGTSFEQISSAIVSLLLDKDTTHDQFVEGFSGVKHQLDGVTSDNDVIEAKDHMLQDQKVGLGEVQEMQGVLTDLDGVSKGFFTSSTGFTNPAQKYADGTTTNPRQTPIHPMTIRPIVEKDREGRVESIKIILYIVDPEYNTAQWTLILPEGEKLPPGNDIFRISELHDCDGNLLTTVNDLINSQPINLENIIEDTWIDQEFMFDSYIKADGHNIHILGIKCHVHVTVETEEIVIKANGDPVLLSKCDQIGVDKLITDTDLRKALQKVISK